jgi:hypothetical protein
MGDKIVKAENPKEERRHNGTNCMEIWTGKN